MCLTVVKTARIRTKPSQAGSQLQFAICICRYFVCALSESPGAVRTMRPFGLATLIAWAICMLSALQVRANSSSPTPLFDDFKRFCIDTDAVPDRVQAAADAAGALPETDWKDVLGATMRTWTHASNAYVVQVTSSVERHEHMGKRIPRDMYDCSVEGSGADNSSIHAARDWAAVRPSYEHELLSSYNFNTIGGKHIAIANDDNSAANWAATDKGRGYSVFIVSGEQPQLHVVRAQALQTTR